MLEKRILLFQDFESIKICRFSNNIRLILDQFWHLRSCMPQEASRRPQDCFMLAYLSQFGPNMTPSWLQVGSSWAYVGTKLAPTCLKLDPCWVHFWIPGRPWANPSPSRSLPWGLLSSQTPTCVLQDPKYTPKESPTPPTWTSKHFKMGSQSSLPICLSLIHI